PDRSPQHHRPCLESRQGRGSGPDVDRDAEATVRAARTWHIQSHLHRRQGGSARRLQQRHPRQARGPDPGALPPISPSASAIAYASSDPPQVTICRRCLIQPRHGVWQTSLPYILSPSISALCPLWTEVTDSCIILLILTSLRPGPLYQKTCCAMDRLFPR